MKTTDRFFSFLTANGFVISTLRNWLLSLFIPFFLSKKNKERGLFWFISQLNIHYRKNQFNYEVIEKSNNAFRGGPNAGYRALDAPIVTSSLFTLLAQKPFNILLFQVKKTPVSNLEEINLLIKNYKNWAQVHFFVLTSANKLLFKRYGVTSTAIYVIRPDGYVGFRLNGDNYLILEEYLKRILNIPMNKEE